MTTLRTIPSRHRLHSSSSASAAASQVNMCPSKDRQSSAWKVALSPTILILLVVTLVVTPAWTFTNEIPKNSRRVPTTRTVVSPTTSKIRYPTTKHIGQSTVNPTTSNQHGLFASNLPSASNQDDVTDFIPMPPSEEQDQDVVYNETTAGRQQSSKQQPQSSSTSLQRMRRRKVVIYQKRKAINTAYLFILWYTLSVGYNIYSKKALNIITATNVPLAYATATLQMVLGIVLYIVPVWITQLRKVPVIPKASQRAFVKRLLPISFLHALVHIGGVVSMGAGAVSFTYIVKASEPAVSAALAALVGSFLPWTVYLTLLPVIGGVALVSASELTFSTKAFSYAMLSNVASASRTLVGKKSIDQGSVGLKNMTPSNLYAMITILSSLFVLIPLTLLMEGKTLLAGIKVLLDSQKLGPYLLYTAIASLFYYTYNEVAFLCLNNISPISHAIANTVKRIFIIISSMMVFGNKMTLQGVAGSVLAVGGVLLYSLEKNRTK